jgi:hypothetical protein
LRRAESWRDDLVFDPTRGLRFSIQSFPDKAEPSQRG